MDARIVALEQALADRNQHLQQVANTAAEAAAAAAINAVNQNQGNHNNERRYETACKSLGQAPTFGAKDSWRNFENRFETWWRVNRIDHQDGEFQKRALLSCMRGNAVEMTRPYAEGSQTWVDSPDLTLYLEAFRRIFLPPEESELARSEFKCRKQGRREDISSYLSSKIALWQLAYPEAERSFASLMDETKAGIANRVIKRNLRYAQIVNIQGLRTTAVRLVAAERQCYREGTSESTSLDGLAATTFVTREESDNEMDYEEGGVNAVGGKFNGNCRKCGKYGHKAVECKQKSEAGRSDQKDKRKCFRCDRPGHMVAKCVAKTKANGEKIFEKPGDRKGFKNPKDKNGKYIKGKTAIRSHNEVTDDESEQEEDSFLAGKGDSEEEE